MSVAYRCPKCDWWMRWFCKDCGACSECCACPQPETLLWKNIVGFLALIALAVGIACVIYYTGGQ